MLSSQHEHNQSQSVGVNTLWPSGEWWSEHLLLAVPWLSQAYLDPQWWLSIHSEFGSPMQGLVLPHDTESVDRWHTVASLFVDKVAGPAPPPPSWQSTQSTVISCSQQAGIWFMNTCYRMSYWFKDTFNYLCRPWNYSIFNLHVILREETSNLIGSTKVSNS